MTISPLAVARRSRLVAASPIYYGWVILAVGSLGVIMTSPGQTYSISVFIDHFIVDLGISRSLVSTLYTVGTLAASLALPFVGRQLDRRGARFMMGVVVIAFGLACIYMSAVLNALMLVLGFAALRMLGQGSLSMVSNNAINQWWVRRRGMAMGIAGMSAALLGSGAFPLVIHWLIPQVGWRNGFVVLGLLLLSVMLPLGVLLIRDRPEEYGLLPDGEEGESAPSSPRSVAAIRPIEENWTLAEATHTTAFWLLVAGLASMSMLSTGLTFHIFDIFSSSGLDATVAAAVFLPIAVTSAIVQLAGGLLIDRVGVRLLLSLSLLLQAGVLVAAPFLGAPEIAYAYGLMMGVRSGLQMIVGNVVWAKYFGRRYLGAITGVASTLMVASSALGPMPFGIARDLFGNYTLTLIGLALLPFALAIAILIFGKPPVRSLPAG